MSAIPSTRTSYARGLEEGAEKFHDLIRWAMVPGHGIARELSENKRVEILGKFHDEAWDLLRKANRALRGKERVS